VSEKDRNPLEHALETLLLPVVRLALKRGLAFGRFSEIVKRAYVGAAKLDFAVPGRKLTISRVAVLTGMTRKEASRLLQDDPDANTGSRMRRQVNRAARVVTAWVEDPAFADAAGKPSPLPFEAESGPSFHQLVARHGADVPARAVLDELLRVGAVVQQEDGSIELVERAYIPTADEGAKLDILGTDVADLVSAIDHNLEADRDVTFFQRKVAYDNLPADYLPTLRSLLSERGQPLLEELNAEMSKQDRDLHPDGRSDEESGRSRAMIGIYYYEEPNDDGGE
jgi:hypothetical protein